MNKRIFTLCVALSVMTVSAMAATLKVGDKTITSSQSSISPTGLSKGTIKWDASTKTLTFTNVEMNCALANAVTYDGARINLVFEGKNVIKTNCYDFEIKVSEYCTINGQNAYLELESNPSYKSARYNCIWMSGSGDLMIRNIYLKATANTDAVISSSGGNPLAFQSVWAQLKTNASGKKAVENFTNCIVSSGSYVETGAWSETSKTFVSGSTALAEVNILPYLTVGGTIVDTDQDEYGFDPKGMTDGTIYFEDDGSGKPTLTLNAVTGQIGSTDLPSPYGTSLVYNYNMENLTILFANANTPSAVSGAAEAWGIYSVKPLTVKGYNRSASLTYTGNYGLYCDDDLEIKDLTMTMTGKCSIQGNCTLTGCAVLYGYYENGHFYGLDEQELSTVKIVTVAGGGVMAMQFITDVMVVGTKGQSNIESLISQYKDQGWTPIDKDLNAGAGGDYIYLLYKSEYNTDCLNHGYITDFYIHGSGEKDNKDELTYQGRTYKLVTYKGGDKFMASKGDLNRGGGPESDYIYLYYTKDPMDGRAVNEIVFNETKSGAVGNDGGSTGYDLNTGCSSGSQNIYMHLTKYNATPVKYISYTHDTTNGLTSEKKKCYEYTEVTSSKTTFSNGWYLLSSSQSFDNRIDVDGTVNLILCDGCTLEAKEGIEVKEGNTLNIFAQSEDESAGKVTANGGQYDAGIGGCTDGVSGEITIYGGSVEANGGEYAAGIGGGRYCVGGTITIYGGTVEAHGDTGAAGIGGGLFKDGGTVTIYGGTVTARGGDKAAGIGGGRSGASGEVTIYGGTVEAYGGYDGAGIGAGSGGENHGTLKIDDGVKVYGGDSENPTTVIAIGPSDNVGLRPQYMIAGGHVKGDANDDVRVNAADLVEMVNAKNNKASDRFVLKNADIDGSGNITKSDIDAVEKIIMQK